MANSGGMCGNMADSARIMAKSSGICTRASGRFKICCRKVMGCFVTWWIVAQCGGRWRNAFEYVWKWGRIVMLRDVPKSNGMLRKVVENYKKVAKSGNVPELSDLFHNISRHSTTFWNYQSRSTIFQQIPLLSTPFHRYPLYSTTIQHSHWFQNISPLQPHFTTIQHIPTHSTTLRNIPKHSSTFSHSSPHCNCNCKEKVVQVA